LSDRLADQQYSLAHQSPERNGWRNRGDNIGRIEISETFRLIDLPVGMPREIFTDLKKVRVCGQQLKISHRPGQVE